jgi:glycylpeptide N-tetradecanoyltransferase
MAKKSEEHKWDYWKTQPVPKIGEAIEEEGPVESKTLEQVAKEPLAIASTFEWWSPDINNDNDLLAIHTLLAENYVEDDSCQFRFNYSMEFLRWALAPPGYYPDWNVAVRKKSDGQLLAFISGIPLHVHFGGRSQKICEINFLCVHKKLRSRRMAPILITEVTRRVNLCDIWQAIYTAGVVLPRAFAVAQYFHRSINVQKLVAIGFSRVPKQYEKFARPLEALQRNYTLPDKPTVKHLRPMEEKDCSHVAEMLNRYLAKFKVAIEFDVAEVKHWLLPRPNVLWSFVVENPTTGEPTDFVSFYALPSTVIGNTQYPVLKAAYSYYYVAKTMSVLQLMNEALILAKMEGFDVFNTLNQLDNDEFIEKLKFAPGDGKLNFYMYNWKLKEVKPSEVGLVML